MKRRTALILSWVCLSIGGWAFDRYLSASLRLHDEIAHTERLLNDAIHMQDWPACSAAADAVLANMPDDAPHYDDRIRAIIAGQKARANQGQAIEAIALLVDLQRQLGSRPETSEQLRSDVRAELGRLYYLTAWRMRLEGSPVWTTQIERARQQFLLLARTSTSDAIRKAAVINTEAAIRLQRMDLAELRATPFPPEGNGVEKQPAKKQQEQGDPNEQQKQPNQDGSQSDAPRDADPGKGGNTGGKVGTGTIGS